MWLPAMIEIRDEKNSVTSFCYDWNVSKITDKCVGNANTKQKYTAI